jgi:microcystin-dependent protein
MSVTPYMNLTLPTASVTEGPDYAEQNTEAFEAVDAHDHTPGKGTPVPAAGLDIDSDLNMQENELDSVGAVNLVSQSVALPASNVQSIYAINGNLWYNNSSGTPVQITQGSSVTSAASPLVPTGVIWPYGGASAPTGFLLCDGTAVSRSTYSDLFAVLGVTYGAGNGSTTFNLPSSYGRTPVGAGEYTDPVQGSVTRALGATGGAAQHVLSQGELAAHDHGGGGHQHAIAANADGSGVISGINTLAKHTGFIDTDDNYRLGGVTADATLGLTSTAAAIVLTTGSNTAHNNMQPYFVTNFIIKT